MTGHPTPHRYRVSGENAPRWIAWGLILLGGLGSVTATLLLAPIFQDITPRLPWWGGGETQILQPELQLSQLDAAKNPKPPSTAAESSPSPHTAQEPPPSDASGTKSHTTSITDTLPHPRVSESPLNGPGHPGQSPAPLPITVLASESKSGSSRPVPPRESAVRLLPGAHGEPRVTEETEELYSELSSGPGVITAPSRTAEHFVATPPKVATSTFDANALKAEMALPSAPVATTPNGSSPLGQANVGQAAERVSPALSAEPVRDREPERIAAPAPVGRNATDAEERARESSGPAPESPLENEAADCAPMFTVHFDHGSMRPLEENLAAKIERLAGWLLDHEAAKVIVEGHADSSGPDEYNLLLSYRRASIVSSLLREAGVPDDRLAMSAYGESLPLAQAMDSKRNRRVSLRVDPHPGCTQPVTNKENSP